MTTPTIDFVMPYGVMIETNSDGGSSIVGDHPQKIGIGSLKLIPGPCRLSFSWGGPTRCQLVLVTQGQRLTIAEVPSGGTTFYDGHRRSARRRCDIRQAFRCAAWANRDDGGLPHAHHLATKAVV